MSSLFTPLNGLKGDDAIHSPIVDGAAMDTPAHTFAVSRIVNLGLTKEEAQALIKGQ
jgi:hypothetical protein